MPVLKKVTNYLDENNIKYDVVEHKTVYTALDKAATLGVRPQAIVKTLVVKIRPQEYAFAILPAHRKLDKLAFKKAINKWRQQNDLSVATQASLATERWMRSNVTGSIGATPPFGFLYTYPTVVDSLLVRQRDVYIGTGDYTVSLRLTQSRWKKALRHDDVTRGSISKARK